MAAATGTTATTNTMNMKVYTREQLAVFDLLDQPVWVFDVDGKAMWWANSKAVELWNASSVSELVARDFASDMSAASAARLQDYLKQFRQGKKIKDQWTFYPNGQGPVTVMTTASGIHIQEGKLAMLVEGVEKNLLEAAAEATLNPSSVNDAAIQRSKKRRRTDNLLFDVFPRHVAHALREGRKVEPELRQEVTVCFFDIVGFTTISASLCPLKVSDMLDRLYQRVDELSRRHNVYKVETIGDAYMAVTNLIVNQPDHCYRMAVFAQDAIAAANSTLIDMDEPQKGCVNIRVGLHTGPVVANVIGSRNPRYCLFGDTVNCASRMESSSAQNQILCSEKVAELLPKQTPTTPLVANHTTTIQLEPRGKIPIKGKGFMEPYWVHVHHEEVKKESRNSFYQPTGTARRRRSSISSCCRESLHHQSATVETTATTSSNNNKEIQSFLESLSDDEEQHMTHQRNKRRRYCELTTAPKTPTTTASKTSTTNSKTTSELLAAAFVKERKQLQEQTQLARLLDAPSVNHHHQCCLVQEEVPKQQCSKE